LDLNKDNISVITTPHKERLEKVQSVLFEARRLQVLADKAPGMRLESLLFYRSFIGFLYSI